MGVHAAEKELLLWEALRREATNEEMRRDPTVLMMGEAGREANFYPWPTTLVQTKKRSWVRKVRQWAKATPEVKGMLHSG